MYTGSPAISRGVGRVLRGASLSRGSFQLRNVKQISHMTVKWEGKLICDRIDATQNLEYAGVSHVQLLAPSLQAKVPSRKPDSVPQLEWWWLAVLSIHKSFEDSMTRISHRCTSSQTCSLLRNHWSTAGALIGLAFHGKRGG